MENSAANTSSAGSEVALAVERLAAARIGRALPPLALLAVYGLIQSIRFGFSNSDHLVVFLGALASAGSMVAYGAQAVKRVMETRNSLAGLSYLGSFIPYLFGGYLFVTRGLQLVRSPGQLDTGGRLVAVALMLVGVLCVRSQWRLTEVHLLAREMTGLANIAPQ
jgi:hypothetical protein